MNSKRQRKEKLGHVVCHMRDSKSLCCFFRDGCRASEELFWKLTVLQQFIAELNWPDEVLASHLMKRLKLMASDMVQSCVKRYVLKK